MHLNTKRLILAVAILIVFIYLRFYMTVVSEIKIVQLSLTDLTPAILMQKNPIVIDERIVNPMSLLHTVFKYMYIYKRFKTVENDMGVLKQSKSRYLIFASNQNNSSIEITNPRLVYKDEEPPFVEIKLHANQCMVLPYKWYYRLKDPTRISSIALEDIVSLTCGKLF